MADKIEYRWNMQALGHVIGTAPETLQAIREATARIEQTADSLGGGYMTGRYYDRAEGVLKGRTPAEYRSEVKSYSHAHHGIVYAANYAAEKDNLLHNTLLKAVGNG